MRKGGDVVVPRQEPASHRASKARHSYHRGDGNLLILHRDYDLPHHHGERHHRPLSHYIGVGVLFVSMLAMLVETMAVILRR